MFKYSLTKKATPVQLAAKTAGGAVLRAIKKTGGTAADIARAARLSRTPKDPTGHARAAWYVADFKRRGFVAGKEAK
jgi:hypothetical protein